MKKITWDVHFAASPMAVRYCKKCQRKTEHASSGRFRVNAQGKYLDIWLIYKCTACESTWNLPIYSRINPDSISRSLLTRFQDNDEKLAGQYAFSAAFLKNSGAEIRLPDYQVNGLPIPHGIDVELQIKSQYTLPIKISAILRNKLQISQRELETLIKDNKIQGKSEKIQYSSPRELKKYKLNQDVTLYLNLP